MGSAGKFVRVYNVDGPYRKRNDPCQVLIHSQACASFRVGNALNLLPVVAASTFTPSLIRIESPIIATFSRTRLSFRRKFSRSHSWPASYRGRPSSSKQRILIFPCSLSIVSALGLKTVR